MYLFHEIYNRKSYCKNHIIVLVFLLEKQNYFVPEVTEKYLKQKKNGFIFAGWHNQILSLTRHVAYYLQRDRHILLTPLVSLSKDGEFIYQTFLRFKMQSVRGSTSKGGSTALRQIQKLSKGRVPILLRTVKRSQV